MTIVNRGDRILRHYDAQIRDRLLQISLMKGIEFKFNAPFEKIEKQATARSRSSSPARTRSRRTSCSGRSAARPTSPAWGWRPPA